MKLVMEAVAAQYVVPPMPNRQQRRAAERKVQKHPHGSVITIGPAISTAQGTKR